VCLQKESYRVLSWWLFVSYEWYNSCHSTKSRLLCREDHYNTYIRYVLCYCLFISIYTLKIHLSRWEGCYNISVTYLAYYNMSAKSLWPFSFGHCISGPLIEGFWLSLWYIQPVLFCITNIQTLMDTLSIWFVPPVWELVCLLLEVKQFHWDVDTPIWPYTTD
jgi:hypothetical protein